MLCCQEYPPLAYWRMGDVSSMLMFHRVISARMQAAVVRKKDGEADIRQTQQTKGGRLESQRSAWAICSLAQGAFFLSYSPLI